MIADESFQPLEGRANLVRSQYSLISIIQCKILNNDFAQNEHIQCPFRIFIHSKYKNENFSTNILISNKYIILFFFSLSNTTHTHHLHGIVNKPSPWHNRWPTCLSQSNPMILDRNPRRVVVYYATKVFEMR